MILNEEFFDDFDEKEYSPDIELDDYSKYGGIDGHQYKLTIKVISNDRSDYDSNEYGLESDAWKECIEVAYDLFELSDFESQFDHSEFIYYHKNKEFVMGFSRNGTNSANFNITESFFEDLLLGFHKAYEGNYKEIVISITKMMYSKYPFVTGYIKDKSDVKMTATKIAYKL